jgi:dipeptidyl aminopeptidase/acylaminoacyl peptidase
LSNFRHLAACLFALLPVVAVDAAADELIEQFATLESAWTAQIASDGKRVALGCTNRQARAVCIYPLDSVGQPPQIIALPADQLLLAFSWLDADWLMLEVGQAQFSPSARVWSFDRNRLARNIHTGQTSALGLAEIAAIVPDAPGEVLVRRKGGVLRADLARDGRVIRREPFRTRIFNAWFDARAEQVLALRANRDGTGFFAISGKKSTPVPLELGYSPDRDHPVPAWAGIAESGSKLGAFGYFESDFMRYHVFDTKTGKRLPSDARLPTDRDIDGWIAGPASDEVLGVNYTSDVPRQIFFDPTLDSIHARATKALSGQVVNVLSWTRDRSVATLSAAAPGASETFYVFDRKSAALSSLGEARPRLASLPKSTTVNLRYPASDRLPIEAFVTLPPGKRSTEGPFPLIVMPRQHLSGRDDASFYWWAEFFAQRGYAVLRPNFRGATGYGKAFKKSGVGEFGGAMIDDIVDSARTAIGSGLADKKRVCFAGVGYGGYAALMAALRAPDLARCVVAVNAITDPVSMYDYAAKYCATDAEPLRDWHRYMGDRDRIKVDAVAISPARNAWQFSVPVLFLQDTRETLLTKSQSLPMKKQMDLYSRSAQWVEFEAGDPMLLTAQARHAVLTASDAFVTTHLGQTKAEWFR